MLIVIRLLLVVQSSVGSDYSISRYNNRHCSRRHALHARTLHERFAIFDKLILHVNESARVSWEISRHSQDNKTALRALGVNVRLESYLLDSRDTRDM